VSAFFASNVFSRKKRWSIFSLFASSLARRQIIANMLSFLIFSDGFLISRRSLIHNTHSFIDCLSQSFWLWHWRCCCFLQFKFITGFSLVLCGFIFLIDVKKSSKHRSRSRNFNYLNEFVFFDTERSTKRSFVSSFEENESKVFRSSVKAALFLFASWRFFWDFACADQKSGQKATKTFVDSSSQHVSRFTM
jgi:hypothetical protein